MGSVSWSSSELPSGPHITPVIISVIFHNLPAIWTICWAQGWFTFCSTSAQPLSTPGIISTLFVFSVFLLLCMQALQVIFFLSWCVFAITKHYSQGRLFKCAGVQLLYLPLPFIKLFYIKNSQAWSFQRETYTTVPSINKEYNTNGNWKYSPSPLQGFCSWDIARKTVSHLFLPPGLNLLAVRLLHYSCQHFWSYRRWMKQFSSVQITLTPQNKWHAFQIFSHPQKKSIKNWKCLFLVKQWWHPASLTDDSILHITAYD